MEQVAQAISVSKSYISLLEAGERQPSREVVLKLAEALAPQATTLRDELLILAGFAPLSQESLPAYRDAVAICEAHISQHPEDFRAYLRLVYALIKAGRFEQAQQRIQQGMQRFALGVQLQALLATLELSRGDYPAALLHQETALQAYRLHAQPETLAVRPEDLEFNLGAIYFLRGYESLGVFLEQERPQDRLAALDDFAQAGRWFERALVLAPADLYIRDEYARLCFNQAFLCEPAEAAACWERTIQNFRQVLTSPHKHALGQQTLMESGAFLAHACTKSGRLEEAELILGLLESFNPGFWLLHYLQACFYTLSAVQRTEPDGLARALSALQRSIQCGDLTLIAREARRDPDLKALREGCAHDFARLFNQGD